MHAGSWDPRAANHYEVRNGRAYCEWVNVVWQLRDVTQEDGWMCRSARYAQGALSGT